MGICPPIFVVPAQLPGRPYTPLRPAPAPQRVRLICAEDLILEQRDVIISLCVHSGAAVSIGLPPISGMVCPGHCSAIAKRGCLQGDFGALSARIRTAHVRVIKTADTGDAAGADKQTFSLGALLGGTDAGNTRCKEARRGRGWGGEKLRGGADRPSAPYLPAQTCLHTTS
eukprot:854690-Pelagomonas_calceolata.AAC.2